jgi:hypothetical protein
MFKAISSAQASQEKIAMMKAIADAKHNGEGGRKEDKAYDKVTAALEQMRGNMAVQQAEKDLYASKKADSLANLYGDPNKLSPSQVKLLTGEIAKMAQGGSPSIHELQSLDPGTLKGALAGAWGKLQNEPTPANAAAFVNQMQDYSRGIAKDAQHEINDRYGRIINVHRRNLNSNQIKDLEDNYLNRFSEGEKKSGAGPGGAMSFEEFMKAKKAAQ